MARIYGARRWSAWPSRLVLRYLLVAFFAALVTVNYLLWYDTAAWDAVNLPDSVTLGSEHPIEKLMKEAKEFQEERMARRSFDVRVAAARYRARRGRHPPPGFDKWFEAAMHNDAVIIEDYFDRIYKDLTPFWALPREVVARRANTWPFVVRVRKGKARGDGETKGLVPWLQLWTSLVARFAADLPDVDMPINYMDEPRMLVPYDRIAELVKKETASRAMPSSDKVSSKYTGLAALDATHSKQYNPNWSGPDKSYWSLAVKACGPETAAYGVPVYTNWSEPAEFPQNWKPAYAYRGYVQNWTASMDPCSQPHLRQLHGTFIEPLSIASTEELVPIFSGSKLPINNDILLPGAMYLTDDEFYSGGDSHGPPWEEKKNKLVWRGDASGGRTKNQTWHHFHRHRLIEMLNSTTVSRAEEQGTRPLAFPFPQKNLHPSYHQSEHQLGQWLEEFADVGFLHLCAPNECDFLDDRLKISERKPMSEQYYYKFLPDADGNSFSARFRGFMRSTSLPLKATIYAEWHDDRLVPWLHFVPLDNTFQDLYSVLEFFADGDGPGDAAAKYIAERGQDWAEQVLRGDDMAFYVWRLLLEWARLCDENRDTLGYVDDLAS
ncbi:Beta-1,2-xylosyltransferase 1 [Paramyrothecium foliicola]|nr:Beta-1,2-xylosyltransferase 1 [Paramyrothecium foliicola]